MPAGFAMWHRLGPHFGVGADEVDGRVAWACVGMLAIGVALMACFGGE